jgi:Ion channel
MLTPLVTTLRRRASAVLMFILIGVILASPVADKHPRAGVALSIVVLSSVIFGASLAGNRKVISRIAVPLSGLWVLTRIVGEFGGGSHICDHLAHAVGLGLSCTLLWALSVRIRGASRVNSDVIAESMIVYLIVAIAYFQLYWILNDLLPQAFNHVIVQTDSASLLYFSMVTLTSVGYGGILPINPFVRLVAGFETMCGIFYIAIVVSRLVSSYELNSRDHRRRGTQRVRKLRARRDLKRGITPLTRQAARSARAGHGRKTPLGDGALTTLAVAGKEP